MSASRQPPVYVRPMPRDWWLRTPAFRRFAAREFTAVFVGAFSVILLLFLWALSRGPQAYAGFLRVLKNPAMIGLHALILAAVLYHTVTWLRLTAHVQEIRVRRTLIRPTASLFGVWILASEVLAYLHIWL